MANHSAPESSPHIAAWNHDNDERTVAFSSADAYVHALDELHRVDTQRPAPFEAWHDNQPTRIASASGDSEVLDAHALFADLAFAPPLGVPANGAGLMLPPPPPVLITSAPSWPPTPVAVPASPRRRRDAATVRVRRRQAADAQRARLLAIIACGTLALVAALAACFVYAMPSHSLTTRSPARVAVDR